MTAADGWIPGVKMYPSGNHGGSFSPASKILVVHYTAATSAQGSIAWLRTPASKASAHVVISPEGETVQLVPLTLIAWHAGKSSLARPGGPPLVGLNAYSWGMELVNPGPCVQVNGQYFSGGHTCPNPVAAVHANGGPWTHWAPYPEAQYQAAVAFAKALPGLEEITGHDVIAPGRKWDPGPAWDMEKFRKDVFG
jgi:N-acetylmuramoyl-L-alanine amidase